MKYKLQAPVIGLTSVFGSSMIDLQPGKTGTAVDGIKAPSIKDMRPKKLSIEEERERRESQKTERSDVLELSREVIASRSEQRKVEQTRISDTLLAETREKRRGGNAEQTKIQQQLALEARLKRSEKIAEEQAKRVARDAARETERLRSLEAELARQNAAEKLQATLAGKAEKMERARQGRSQADEQQVDALARILAEEAAEAKRVKVDSNGQQIITAGGVDVKLGNYQRVQEQMQKKIDAARKVLDRQMQVAEERERVARALAAEHAAVRERIDANTQAEAIEHNRRHEVMQRAVFEESTREELDRRARIYESRDEQFEKERRQEEIDEGRRLEQILVEKRMTEEREELRKDMQRHGKV